MAWAMRRKPRLGDAPPPVIDSPSRGVPNHALLVAAVAVRQAGTRTAQLAGRIRRHPTKADPVHALVATFLHGDNAAAARALGGSFHPRIAEAVPGAETENVVNSPLTLAF